MVFEDPSRARWKRILYISFVTALVGTVVIADAIVIHMLVEQPPVPNAELYDKEYRKREDDRKELATYRVTKRQEAAANLETEAPRMSEVAEHPRQKELDQRLRKVRYLPFFPDKPFLQGAYVLQSDSRSVESLGRNVDKIDVAFPDMFSIRWPSCVISESVNWQAFETLTEKKISVLPTFSNAHGNDVWKWSDFAEFVKNQKQSKCLVDALKWNVRNRSVQGVNVDIVGLRPEDRDVFTEWLLSLVESFHADGLFVAVSVRADDPAYDYRNISKMSDLVVVKAYDQHGPLSKPGPVSGLGWFEGSLDRTLASLKAKRPAKVMVAMGSYGYDWNVTARTVAEERSFDNLLSLAKNTDSEVVTDGKSRNGNFLYRSDDGSVHEVWFSDATAVWNQYLAVRAREVHGVAYWRIGLADPGIWKFASARAADEFDPLALSPLPNAYGTSFAGTGEVFRILRAPEDGRRELTLSGRTVENVRYGRLPQNLAVSLFGKQNDKTVALTFNNGPDPEYTNRILDVLKKHDVRATFFVMGGKARSNAGIVKREYDEWHVIGHHTLFHPATASASWAGIPDELSETERLLETITEHQALLVRSPYDVDTAEIRPEGIRPLLAVGKMGYLLVGSNVDSKDFSNPGTDAIVGNVLGQLRGTGSNVVVMHDSGGNRAQTVEALEKLIPLLQKQGYRFVTANETLGVSRDAVMPPVSFRSLMVTKAKGWVEWLADFSWTALSALFFSATTLAIFRIVFLGFLVFRSRKAQEKFYSENPFAPPVTILVPAYNEDKVIERTVRGLLKSDYPEMEIMVIDDGSTDDTAKVVRELEAEFPNVRLITKKNEGKSLALNLGFKEAKYDYVVTIDADTIVYSNTVRHLMEPFAMEDVDAVCGNIEVGNVNNVLTSFQEVEYVTGQNFDRRAFDALNCISVVPGATGAWRKKKVVEIGGYSGDTLVEDADLTLTLLESGGKIVYAPEARSVTEAPETVRALFKQRFRWSYGTFQCFWKHRGTFGKGALGIVALPNMIFSQVIFNMLSPVGDVILLVSLFIGEWKMLLTMYLLFFAMDLIATGTAYALDKRSPRNAWVILITRFFYRQFMYLVTFKSLIAALRGSHHGWNKLERKGTVTVSEAA